jgi:hypothetical protein
VAAALAESPRFLILDFRRVRELAALIPSALELGNQKDTHRCPSPPTCRRVQGLDATAARSFVTLHNRLQALGIQARLCWLRFCLACVVAALLQAADPRVLPPLQLILTHMDPNKSHIRKLLAAQGLPLRQPTPGALAGDDGAQNARDLPFLCQTRRCCDLFAQVRAPGMCHLACALAGPMCLWFPSMDAGCHFCEEHFLAAARQHGLCPPQAPCLTLAEVLRAHLELPRCIFGTKAVDYDAAAAQLERFTEKQELR